MIPVGWNTSRLRDLLASVSSGARPKGGAGDLSNGVFSLGGEHVTDDGNFDLAEGRFIPEDFYSSIKQEAEARTGDILINKDGAKTGKLAIVREYSLPERSCINEHLFRLRAETNLIEPEYLFAFLLSGLGQAQIQREVQGAAQGGITRKFTKFVMVNYPSNPDEQAAIVSVLRAADEAIAKAKEELDAARRVKTALMQRVFREGLEQPKTKRQIKILNKHVDIRSNWERGRLGDLVRRVQYGTNAPSNDREHGYRVVAIPQVVASRLELRDAPWVELPTREAEDTRLVENDVLVIRTNGNPTYVGKSTIVGPSVTEDHVVFASYLIRIQTNEDVLRGAYLNYYLASPLGRRQALTLANTSAGNHNLGARSLKQFVLPLPNPKEQDEIIGVLHAAEDTIDAGTSKVTALERLKKSLMQNLLTGKVRVKPMAVEGSP